MWWLMKINAIKEIYNEQKRNYQRLFSDFVIIGFKCHMLRFEIDSWLFFTELRKRKIRVKIKANIPILR